MRGGRGTGKEPTLYLLMCARGGCSACFAAYMRARSNDTQPHAQAGLANLDIPIARSLAPRPAARARSLLPRSQAAERVPGDGADGHVTGPTAVQGPEPAAAAVAGARACA